jgi:hypothetical protein
MDFKTRGDQLKFAIAFALLKARKRIRGLWFGLQEEERFAVAETVVEELRKRGDQWKLDEELPSMTGKGTTTRDPG